MARIIPACTARLVTASLILASAYSAPVKRGFASEDVDNDGDGLSDDFEMKCAQRFKPVVYLEKEEQFGPSTVDAFLSTCNLRKYGSCGSSVSSTQGAISGSNTTAANHSALASSSVGLCLWETAVASRYRGCWWTDPDSTIGPVNSSNLASTASEQCGGNDGCYIRCLRCQDAGKCNNLGMDQASAKGTHGAANLQSVPFYIHVFPDVNGTVQIQYWFFYPFNGPTLGFGTHQGDWEHFSVRVDKLCSTRVGYTPFAHGTPPPWSNVSGGSTGVDEENGHMVVYSAVNSHATYLKVGEHDGGTAITKDYTSRGDRWFPATLVNAGERTCAKSGRRPMQDSTKWIDFTDVWGSDSGFDGSLNDGACDSGPHLQWTQEMPAIPC